MMATAQGRREQCCLDDGTSAGPTPTMTTLLRRQQRCHRDNCNICHNASAEMAMMFIATTLMAGASTETATMPQQQ
jgi:hypothetical protein